MNFENRKAPEKYDPNSGHTKIFLGGSIEMGKAIDWQTRLTNDLSQFENVMVLNPRRDDWDSTWSQTPVPGTQFHEQVSWELDGQDNAEILVYYFAEDTNSPITLMELGLYANSGKDIFVYCTEKFYRYGNVKMVCDKYQIPVASTYDELLVRLNGAIPLL